MESVPPNPQQVVDAEHLRLLSIFNYVMAGMAALFACFPVFHVIFGLVLLLAPQKFAHGAPPPPAFMGWLFLLLGAFFIVAGWTFATLVFFSGRFMARRTHYTYCFVMSCVECLFMPFGTVLGVFSIIVLNRPTVRSLFEQKRGF